VIMSEISTSMEDYLDKNNKRDNQRKLKLCASKILIPELFK
jgi:hypothetical protein